MSPMRLESTSTSIDSSYMSLLLWQYTRAWSISMRASEPKPTTAAPIWLSTAKIFHVKFESCSFDSIFSSAPKTMPSGQTIPSMVAPRFTVSRAYST